jgi:hypothetical protein
MTQHIVPFAWNGFRWSQLPWREVLSEAIASSEVAIFQLVLTGNRQACSEYTDVIAPGMPNPTIAQNLGPTPGDLLAKDTAANVTVLPIQNGMETRPQNHPTGYLSRRGISMRSERSELSRLEQDSPAAHKVILP